jgi:Protein of unknown function (DUF3489)
MFGSRPAGVRAHCGASVVTARNAVTTEWRIPMKLTDTQLVLLSAASQREDGGIELVPTLRGGAAHKVVGKLLTDGLLEEIPASGTLPVWRRDEDKGPLALRITQRGLAIRADDDGPSPKAEEGPDTEQLPDLPPRKRAHQVATAGRKKSRNELPRSSAKSSRAGSKKAEVIEMLHRRPGATIAAITRATGWQQHTVRGFFAAVVRKKLGFNLTSEKTGKERVYRIVAGKAATKGKVARRRDRT